MQEIIELGKSKNFSQVTAVAVEATKYWVGKNYFNMFNLSSIGASRQTTTKLFERPLVTLFAMAVHF